MYENIGIISTQISSSKCFQIRMCSKAMINFPCLCCNWNGIIHPMQGHNSQNYVYVSFLFVVVTRAYKHTITTKYWTEALLIKWAHLAIHNKRYLHVRPITRVPPFRVLHHFICVVFMLYIFEDKLSFIWGKIHRSKNP